MKSYNNIERSLALMLSKFPRVKMFLKKVYQLINSFLYRKTYSEWTKYLLEEINIDNKETFFGYYDKSPINESNHFIIFHSTNIKTKNKPTPNPINIVLYDCTEKEILTKLTSNAYNWQQGSKLQWINKNKFIFNDYNRKTNNYCARIIDINEPDSEQAIDFPIYDVHSDFALSLNFDRLNLLRPDYGYRNRCVNYKDLSNYDDGIFYIELENNTSRLIISIDEVINLHFKENMKNAKHWFNHIMISPNGDKFMFLHRWLVGNRKFDSLIVSDIDGANVSVLADDDMVSHCSWYGNNKIISYMRDMVLGDKYFLIDLGLKTKTILGKGVLDKFGDGHPSVINDLLLFDTYPNKARMKELFLFYMRENRLVEVGEFYESMKFSGETRCDLHPRFSNCGSYIFIDSVHSGKRKLYRISLDKVIK
jgi:hypothetical protein